MNRRTFLLAAGAAPATLTLAHSEPHSADEATSLAGWRTFEVTMRVEVLKPTGVTRVWVPVGLTIDTPFQRTLSRTVHCEEGKVRIFENKPDSLAMVAADFASGAKPVLSVTNRVATRDWSVDLATAGRNREASAAQLSYWLRPTKLTPTDGIVKEKALSITARAKTEIDKARAIYDWIVENTYRNPQTPGCGRGNIRYMLEANDLGGKCADLNALYVGLARAAGLPARDVYGIRLAKSQLGYKSLGPATGNVTKAQHCRAQVYLREYGWVAVDPADVRKVMLEEPPGNRPREDEMVQTARTRLFGSWEMNWMAYNFGNEVTLPGSNRPALGFLMYPQAETGEGPLDSLHPETFQYEISAKEI